MSNQIVSGIYQIENDATGSKYVGSSVNLRNRWSTHKSDLRQGKHHSYLLQDAWDKYGADSFSFSILEYVEDIALLLPKEQEYLDALFSACTRSQCYNVCRVAGASFTGKEHTNDVREKSAYLRTGGRMCTIVSPEGVEYKDVVSIRLFAETHGISASKLSDILNGRVRTCKGWKIFIQLESGELQMPVYKEKPRKRFKRSEENKAQVAFTKSGGKRYTLIAPDQTIHARVVNLAGFCKDHAKEFPQLRATSFMKNSYCCGWFSFVEPSSTEGYNALLAETLEKSRNRKTESIYTIISPDGTIYPDVVRLTDFAKAHGLTTSALCVTLNGKRPHHKGWTGYIQS